MSYLLFGHQSNIRSSLSETPQHRVRAHMNQRHMIYKLHHTTHAAAEISALLLYMAESGKCWGHDGEREARKTRISKLPASALDSRDESRKVLIKKGPLSRQTL